MFCGTECGFLSASDQGGHRGWHACHATGVPNFTAAQFGDVPVPQVQEQMVEVFKVIPQQGRRMKNKGGRSWKEPKVRFDAAVHASPTTVVQYIQPASPPAASSFDTSGRVMNLTVWMGTVTDTEGDLDAGLFDDSEWEEVVRHILQTTRQAFDTMQGVADDQAAITLERESNLPTVGSFTPIVLYVWEGVNRW